MELDTGLAEAAAVESHRFPCPSCGADLRYAPELDALKCAHCGHEEKIREDRGRIPELDLRAIERNALPPSETEALRIAQCPSCGARIEFDADIHAKECPFCASPIVTDTGVERLIKPQAQLPFLISEDQARQGLKAWLGRLWFAPSDLKAYARADRSLDGIYIPYWTYDAETRSSYTGQRGTVHYVTRPATVVVNGRTAAVQGERPWSSWKIGLAIAVAVLIAFLIAALQIAESRF